MHVILRSWVIVMLVIAAGSARAATDISGTAIVLDGDTVKIGDKKVRFFGIDAPESGQWCSQHDQCIHCGKIAKDELAKLIGDKSVRCETTGAVTYGRPVGTCFVGDTNLNAEMARQGWAIAYIRYTDEYLDEAKQARSAKRGIWNGEFVWPEDWRDGGRLESCEDMD